MLSLLSYKLWSELNVLFPAFLLHSCCVDSKLTLLLTICHSRICTPSILGTFNCMCYSLGISRPTFEVWNVVFPQFAAQFWLFVVRTFELVCYIPNPNSASPLYFHWLVLPLSRYIYLLGIETRYFLVSHPLHTIAILNSLYSRLLLKLVFMTEFCSMRELWGVCVSQRND